MLRDELITLILCEVPADGDIYVENGNIHDRTMQILTCKGNKTGGYFQFTPEDGTYYLLQGKVG